MSADAQKARSIFLAAVEGRAPDQWGAFLDEACAGDPDLRRRVEVLLQGHAQPNRLLDDPGPQLVTTANDRLPECPGAAVGPYRLLAQIGEGGFGIVYAAEQQEPVRRKVALKVLKPGMDTRQVVARFEAERQALALMAHPNIAHVFDAGTTPSGRPYFVMELIEGLPLVDYCDEHRLTPRQRLDLFVQVCQAVQHAHQKGVIHRDLKPSNILVGTSDGRPVPKVIDFGVAKALGTPVAGDTGWTHQGALVGTFEYMSPEQAGAEGVEGAGVDTRSDVYSLGVLLYELLTGTTPLRRERLRDAALAELLRVIKEEEPEKPSTRLSDSGEGLAAISARRGIEPARLKELVRGDLDWIVMKCLEKDRARRYETVSGLAQDIRRHLADEPVEACPPSRAYRLRKFARRHRGALATAALLAGVLAGTAGVSTWLAVRASRAEQDATEQRDAAVVAEARAGLEAERAKADRDRALKAERLAKQAEDRAKSEADAAEAVSDFLRRDLLAQADAYRHGWAGWTVNRDIKLKTVLDRAAAKIEGKFPDRPLVEAAVRQTVGTTYLSLGEYQAARPHLEQAVAAYRGLLGEDDPKTLLCVGELGLLCVQQDRFDEAEPLLTRALEGCRRVLGEEHVSTLVQMNNLALLYQERGQPARAEPLYTRVLQATRASLGPTHPNTLAVLTNLAQLHQSRGAYAQAEPLFVQALEEQRKVRGPEHPQTLRTMINLGEMYLNQGRHAEAEPLLTKTLELCERVQGADHGQTLVAANNLGLLYRQRRQYDKAEPLLVRAVEGGRRVLGEENQETLSAMNNLGLLYQDRRQYAKAEPLLARAVEVGRRVLGREHPRTLQLVNNLGCLHRDQGQPARAAALLAEAVDGYRRGPGVEHRDALVTMNNLAGLYDAQKQHGDAERLYAEVLEVARRVLPPEHPELVRTVNNFGMHYYGRGQYARAEPLLVEGLELSRRVDRPESLDALVTKNNVALLYEKLKRYGESERLYLEVLETSRRAFGAEHPQTLLFAYNLGALYRAQGADAKAEPVFVEIFEARRRALGAEHPQTLAPMGMLVAIYEKQGRHADAEPLYRQALTIQRKLHGDESEPAATVLAVLGRNLLRSEKHAEAERHLREAVKIWERKPSQGWRRFVAESLLGGSLLGQKKHAEAEPLLLSGYEGIKRHEGRLPAEGQQALVEAVERLARLYDDWDKPEQAGRWRNQLKVINAPPVGKEEER